MSYGNHLKCDVNNSLSGHSTCIMFSPIWVLSSVLLDAVFSPLPIHFRHCLDNRHFVLGLNGAEFGPVHFKWIAHILMCYELNPSIRICTSEWRGWNADYDICFEISWLWVFQSFKRTISKEIFYGRIAIKIIICNNQQEKRCNEIFHVFKHKWIAKHINMLKLNMECISSHLQFNGLRKNVPAQLDLVQQLNCICYTLTFMENGLNSCFANYNVSAFRSANSRRVVSKKSPNFFFSVEMGLKIIFCYFFIIFTLFQNFISSINVFFADLVLFEHLWSLLFIFKIKHLKIFIISCYNRLFDCGQGTILTNLQRIELLTKKWTRKSWKSFAFEVRL